MSSLQGRSVTRSYKDLIKIETGGQGLPESNAQDALRNVTDGAGNATPLWIGRGAVDIRDGLRIGGTPVSISGDTLNSLARLLEATDGNEVTIQVRGGLRSARPAEMSPREFYIAHDTGEIFYGLPNRTVSSMKLKSSAIIDKDQPNGVAGLGDDGRIDVNQLPLTVAKRDGSVQDNLNSELWGGHRIIVAAEGVYDQSSGQDGDVLFEY